MNDGIKVIDSRILVLGIATVELSAQNKDRPGLITPVHNDDRSAAKVELVKVGRGFIAVGCVTCGSIQPQGSVNQLIRVCVRFVETLGGSHGCGVRLPWCGGFCKRIDALGMA